MAKYVPIAASNAFKKLQAKKKQASIIFTSLVVLLVLVLSLYNRSTKDIPDYTQDCKSYGPLKPAYDISLDQIFTDKDYQDSVIEKLLGAVRIPTEIYDDSPNPDLSIPLDQDPIFKNFSTFHDYLEKAFPLVHKHLTVETVNSAGLLFTWETKHTNTSAKPLLLMAHQDVVPVNKDTIDRWTYPPFEGVYEKKTGYIYGRGASDTKQLIIAQLEAIELLISTGWEPTKRPLLVAYGFDEECGGELGAQSIAKVLFNRYGANGLYGLLDEGGGTTYFGDGDYLAAPAIAEKGYVDTVITLNTKGGHSSAPYIWDFDQTSIGILSELNYFLENDQFEIDIAPNNPALGWVQCKAKYDKTFSTDLVKGWKSGSLKKLGQALTQSRLKFLFKTTQAMDIIHGGVKANAMPEQVSELINHRINTKSSVGETLDQVLSSTVTVADKYDLGIILEWTNGTETSVLKEGTKGDFIITVKGALEPAPITPTGDDEMWNLVGSTVVNTFKNPFFGEDQDVYFEGTISTGNTDTKWESRYKLTNRIYRFSAALENPGSNAHTVDEKSSDKSLISALAFIYQIIGNVDAYSTD
ncbi:hypothetical protein ACO0QE_003408 [Hanseniaspora vineae]